METMLAWAVDGLDLSRMECDHRRASEKIVSQISPHDRSRRSKKRVPLPVTRF